MFDHAWITQSCQDSLSKFIVKKLAKYLRNMPWSKSDNPEDTAEDIQQADVMSDRQKSAFASVPERLYTKMNDPANYLLASLIFSFLRGIRPFPSIFVGRDKRHRVVLARCREVAFKWATRILLLLNVRYTRAPSCNQPLCPRRLPIFGNCLNDTWICTCRVCAANND